MAFDLFGDISIILTLVVLESVLSFDNAAILAVMSRKLPVGGGRRRALNYGLLIAYVLRIIAIFSAIFLMRFPLFLTVGGTYLVVLFVRHFWSMFRRRGDPAGEREVQEAKGFWKLSPMQSVVLQIGLVDLAFALDQVVAAVAFTQGLPDAKARALIIVAASVGLVSLRLLAPVISRMMDWLPILEHIAFVAVGFVGLLLILDHPFSVHLGQSQKIFVTLGLFAVPILIKLIFKIPASDPAHKRPYADDVRAQSKKP